MNFSHNNFLRGIMLSFRIDACLYNFLSIILLCETTKIGKPKEKLFLLICFLITEEKLSLVVLKMWFPYQQQQRCHGEF